ncbi:MAG: hypothetical protein MJ197_08745 [Bacteroidales bacterium]|nr:hypothetical protein [Bacteroidales bacterium]
MENKELFSAICEANKLIKTTNIKGKEYAEVPQRVKAFRSVYPSGSIETELVSIDNQQCIIKATIKNNDGVVIASDYSQEYIGKGDINTTSFLENCSTSAVGRALGFCGFGSDVSIASANDVQHAIELQKSLIDDTIEAIKSKTKVEDLENFFRELNDAQKKNASIIESCKLQKQKIVNGTK